MNRTMTRLTVRDLMSEGVLAVHPNDSLFTVRELMQDRHIRHMPVVDPERNLVGLISHRDLLRNHLVEQAEVPTFVEKAVLERVKVREVMTTAVASVGAGRDIREAAQIMLENKYGCLPVVEGTHLVGILTESDFVRFLADGE